MARRLVALLILAASMAVPLAAQQRVGPKVRIAVTEVEWDQGVTQFASMRGNNSANVVVSEQQTFARGLTEMLIAELLKTDRFIVVERKAMDDIQAEQQLQQSQGNRATQVNVGQLVGAQFLIRPTITEFSYGNQAGTQGGSVRAPVSLPGLGRPRIGGGKSKITASLVLDTRLMDVESGQITTSVRSESQATQEMNNFNFGTALFDYKKTDFEKTPLGAATREAVTDAVQRIVAELGNHPWEGRVVTLQGGQVYLNAGAGSGVKVGDVLELVRAGETLIDPATGLKLGSTETVLGKVQVTSVQEKFSVAAPLDGVTAERGDILRYGAQ